MSSSPRAKAAAAVASAGVLVAGWQAATLGGSATPQPADAATGRSTPSGRSGASTAAPAAGASGTRVQPGSQSGTGTAPTGAIPGQRGGGGGGGGTSVTLRVPAGASGTFTGTPATHRFGSVAVTVTLANGRITALKESVVSDGDRKSNQINSFAVPQLRSAILAASAGQVSTVSGATYTTRAYLTSLQSALDQAG